MSKTILLSIILAASVIAVQVGLLTADPPPSKVKDHKCVSKRCKDIGEWSPAPECPPSQGVTICNLRDSPGMVIYCAPQQGQNCTLVQPTDHQLCLGFCFENPALGCVVRLTKCVLPQ